MLPQLGVQYHIHSEVVPDWWLHGGMRQLQFGKDNYENNLTPLNYSSGQQKLGAH